MRAIPLRWRIIAALIGLALGTTLILALLARHFLALSLQTNVNVEMGSALTSALSLAKENYDAKKTAASGYRTTFICATSPRPQCPARRVCKCWARRHDPAYFTYRTDRHRPFARSRGLQSRKRSASTGTRSSRFATGTNCLAFTRDTHRC